MAYMVMLTGEMSADNTRVDMSRPGDSKTADSRQQTLTTARQQVDMPGIVCHWVNLSAVKKSPVCRLLSGSVCDRCIPG